MSDEEKDQVVQALWSVTETEAACHALLAKLEEAREALRASVSAQ